MPFSITNPAHVSLVIDRVRQSAISLESLRTQLMELDTFLTINGVGPILNAVGAVFPPGFSLTPNTVNSANNTLTSVVRTAITTAITVGQQTNMDRVRLDIGVITGTG